MTRFDNGSLFSHKYTYNSPATARKQVF